VRVHLKFFSKTVAIPRIFFGESAARFGKKLQETPQAHPSVFYRLLESEGGAKL